MEIKAGQIAFLKTTEEPVFVLEIVKTTSDFLGLSGIKATVRRPVLTEAEGFKHHVEMFYIEELESLEQKRNRRVKDMASLEAQIGMAEEVPPVPFKN